MSVAIFNGPYAKILAASGIKLKDDTLILHGVGTPVVTAPNGSIFLSTSGLHVRQLGVWVKLQAPELDINYIDVESWNSTSLLDANITNVGCTVDTTSQINGGNSLKAIHQAASTYSLKKTIAISPKFKNRNATLSLWGKSGASLGNVTIVFRDETNSADIGVSQQISLDTSISNKVFSFTIPATCSSLSYKISYLPQAGSVETFIDDISLFLSQASNFSTTIDFPVASTPTVTKLLSGTGTYTRPANVSHIRVRMVGGGGSGASTGYYSGGSAGATTFGTSLLIANGGSNGQGTNNGTGGAGGTAIINAPAIGTAQTGAGGGGGSISSSNYIVGGFGGASPFGGSPITANQTGGASALANSGSGGSGASGFNTSGGGGGGSGGYIDAIIVNPDATYSYSIGAGSSAAGGGAGGSGYIEITEFNNVNVTRTIPLTTAQLVQESDGYLQMNGFAGALASTANKIFYLTSNTIVSNVGNAIQYISDSVNGDRFIALKEGTFSFKFSNDFGTPSTVIGLSKNSTQLTVGYESLSNVNERLMCSANSDIGSINWTGILKVGDILRLHNVNAALLNIGYGSSISISYQGSLKQINVSSESKINIPTHELRLEGASTRGSVATAIVKFDVQAKIRGDGFEVLNTVADGTVITIKKAGRLSVNANIYNASNNGGPFISINQAVLTTIPTINSELIAVSSAIATTGIAQMAGSVDVKIGDKIRVGVANYSPNGTYNFFQLNLTEHQIDANFSNILPQYSEGDSSVRLQTGNGMGSTNTQVRRFANTVLNLGSSISYTDSSTLGAFFEIKEDGIYDISYSDAAGAAANDFVVSLNSTTIGTGSILAIERASVGGADYATASCSPYLVKGDIVRALSSTALSAHPYTTFTISKQGRPNVTANVTPFVNLKLPDTNIVGEVIAYAGSNIPDNFLDCAGQAVSRTTYSDLFNVIGVSHGSGDGSTTFNVPNYQGRFLRGLANGSANDPDRASRTAMATGGNTGDTVGSVQGDIYGSHNHDNGVTQAGNPSSNDKQAYSPYQLTATTPNAGWVSWAGNFRGFTSTVGGNETRPKNASVRYIIRYMPNQTGVATPTEQISSDTLSFNFKSTPIVSTDPVGTFNVYTYAANTNTPVISTSAPTQSLSSMNINGIQIFGRAWNATSTSANPARIDVFIGKGLKSKQVDAYGALAKTTPISYDSQQLNTTFNSGTNALYSEITGILSIDAAAHVITGTTSRTVGIDSTATTYSSGYFTFTASKSPSLVTIPNLAPRIASVFEKNNTQQTFPSSVWTSLQLNTLEDPTGITALNANALTFQAGTYLFSGSMMIYNTANAIRRASFRIFDGTSSLYDDFGTVISYPISAGFGGSQIGDFVFKDTILTFTSAKTIQFQLYGEDAGWTNGSGQSAVINTQIRTKLKVEKIK